MFSKKIEPWKGYFNLKSIVDKKGKYMYMYFNKKKKKVMIYIGFL